MEKLNIKDATGLEEKLVNTKRIALSMFVVSAIAFVLLCNPLKAAEGNYSVAFMLTVFSTLIPTVVTIFACFLINYQTLILQIQPEQTLEGYLLRHPNHKIKGKVTCYKCDSYNIWMKQYASSPSVVIHSHICRQCGTELYRSKLVR